MILRANFSAGPDTSITYLVPVPEPVTILGSLTVLGFGILMKRQTVIFIV
ncbi:MAG: PEP-CTERM sorting domain-containing protein [Gloeocapsa sp. DLM2.Bin57]|nr:MAG: PEP-CTERM sorting domain-containing protein [Gloeocapsa sp. DLM2.Bin57]